MQENSPEMKKKYSEKHTVIQEKSVWSIHYQKVMNFKDKEELFRHLGKKGNLFSKGKECNWPHTSPQQY